MPFTPKARRHATRTTDEALLNLADTLRNTRVNAGISQEDLALASGVGRTSVIKLENGHPGVSLGVAQQVLSALRLQLAAVKK